MTTHETQAATAIDLLTSILTVDDTSLLPDRIVLAAGQLCGADGASLLLPRPDGSLVVQHAWWRSGDATLGRELAPGEGVAGWVARQGESVFLNSVRKDPRFRALDDRGFIQALIAVPFPLPLGRGVICLYAGKPDAFTDSHLDTARRFAAAAALVVTQAQLRERLARERARAEMALAMCRSVLTTSDFSAQLRGLCAAIATHVGFSRCTVGLVSSDGRTVRGVAAHGLPENYIVTSECPVADVIGDDVRTAIGRCAARNEVIICTDRSADPAFRQAQVHPQPDRIYATQYACVPLRAQGKVIGVITVAPLPGEGEVTFDVMAAVTSFADIVTLTVLQKRA
ncbi:MAG TPA: GAF domain-containing protein [bacterium]|nr:GAF domain-containing protein [bacterium]